MIIAHPSLPCLDLCGTLDLVRGNAARRGRPDSGGAIVAPGKVVRSGTRWAGCPAREMRAMNPEEMAFLRRNPVHYAVQAARHGRLFDDHFKLAPAE